MLQLVEPVEVVDYTDPFGAGGASSFSVGRWCSPVVDVAGGFTELVASWNARTPPGSWVEISVRVWPIGLPNEPAAEEFVLGRWAEDTATIHRTSVGDQAGNLARVDVDVLHAASAARLGAWQLTVSSHRLRDCDVSPTIKLAGAMTSLTPNRGADRPASPPNAPRAVARRTTRVLDVPAYSQLLHRGSLPEYGGGGEAWCSPASTAMLLAYWHHGPSPAESAWLGESSPDRAVAYAAAQTYDYAYGGAGNWSFNAAYAAVGGLAAFVTRLRSLAEAELFIEVGIPLVASVSFHADELTGAGYSTDGHLLVVVGFTSAGEVVVNDPASHLVASNDMVRVVYDRAEFEKAWLSGSGGLVYVVRPVDVPLPSRPTGTDPHW